MADDQCQHVKVHPDMLAHEAETRKWAAKKGSSTPRYIWLWMRIVCWCDSLSLPVPQLIEGFQAKYLLADRGCNTDAMILKAVEARMIPVIPPKKNRKQLRDYDEYLYKLRHFVENTFFFSKDGEALLLSGFAVLLFGLLIIVDTL